VGLCVSRGERPVHRRERKYPPPSPLQAGHTISTISSEKPPHLPDPGPATNGRVGRE